MRDGFVKVAAGTPSIRVADCRDNAESCFTLMREADKQGVRVLALPELCLTGYTCGDLFLQDTLLKGAEEGLATVLEATKNLDMLTALGLPVKNPWDGKLYNCAAVIHKGEILGLVPKTYVPNYGEFYEGRWFTSGKDLDVLLNLCGQQVSIWDREIWACDTMADLVVGVPDSGLDAARGYAQESGIPYGVGFVKNRYVGRTFITPDQTSREQAVRIKLSALRSEVEGRRVVMIDDSIVRGTTCRQITNLLREAGAKEVHIRVSAPPFIAPCYFGTDIPDRERLIACQHSLEEIREIAGADSLGYLPLEDLHQLAPKAACGFCDGCFTERYPVDLE